MTPRVTSQLLIQALIRRVNAQGGFATVLHKGDLISGTIIFACLDGQHQTRLFERMSDFSGGYQLSPVAQSHWGDEGAITQYIARRRVSDPDLWVVELDVPDAERLIAAFLSKD